MATVLIWICKSSLTNPVFNILGEVGKIKSVKRVHIRPTYVSHIDITPIQKEEAFEK